MVEHALTTSTGPSLRRHGNMLGHKSGVEKRTNGAEKRTNGVEKRTNGVEKRTNGPEKRTNGPEKRKCTLGPPYRRGLVSGGPS